MSEDVDVVVIGAGFGGLGVAAGLRREGIASFVVLERADDVGGVWRDNTYPGAGCDVPSHLYSFSFAPSPYWSRRYAPQPEILDYLRGVADDLDLRRHLRTGAAVERAEWDGARWRVRCADGRAFSAVALVTATGQLSEPAVPDLPGLDEFAGPAFHSARWDHDVELAGRRVAVVGTGASAIQFVPRIAPDAAHTTVFARSAPHVVPKHDPAYPRWARRLLARVPGLLAANRLREYVRHEVMNLGLLGNRAVLAAGTAWARRNLARHVTDPAARRALTPDHPLGCKRLLRSDDWYPTLDRDDVTVVDAGVAGVERDAVVDTAGRRHPADVIVLGTGFRATEFLAGIDVRGAGGRSLHEVWADGAEAHLGITVAGFPNLFVVYGPNTNLGGNSVLYMIESQVRFLRRALPPLLVPGAAALDTDPAAQRRWARELTERFRGTVWDGGCDSWYRTADGRDTANWPGPTPPYRRRTRRPRPRDYSSVTRVTPGSSPVR